MALGSRGSPGWRSERGQERRAHGTESRIRSAIQVLDEHLANRPFIVGDELTLADIDIAAPFPQVDRSKPPLTEFPNLMSWQQHLLETAPAWAKTRRDPDGRTHALFSPIGLAF
ncbi:MAG: glutathione S-transferase family protein [Pseudomonadota bacterium]|nr:glutathione S-transferase family protein [Pseudomonadota bacterium]